jgi:hypothetical protein
MNRNLVRCIVESLRVTGPNEESLARLRTFSERDWKHVLTWLDESGLGLYLLRRLSELDLLDALPTEIRTQFQCNQDTNRRRLSIMKEEFASLNRHFAAAGVDYVVLKGFALVPEFCPDAALRSQYDYDFLVRPGSAPAAHHILQSRGYARKIKSPGFQKEDESFFTAEALAIPSPDQNFYSPNIPRAVELHLGLWESDRDNVKVQTPKDVLDRKRLANWEGLCFPVLAGDDSLIFQSLHAFQHILDYWCRPSCFLEIAHFLAGRRGDKAFWERFRLRVGSYRYLPQIVGIAFAMAEMLFQAPIPPEVSAWTTSALPAPLTLWAERYGREWALAPHPGSKLSLFAHEVFIEDPESWKAVRRSRLLPFHRPATVVESADQHLASSWRAKWEQARFNFSRLKFHLGGLLRYTWESPSWKENLRRIQRSGYERIQKYPSPISE